MCATSLTFWPQKPLATLHGSGGPVHALTWADRAFFISGGADHCVRVWDAQAGRNTHTLVRAARAVLDMASFFGCFERPSAPHF